MDKPLTYQCPHCQLDITIGEGGVAGHSNDCPIVTDLFGEKKDRYT